MSAAERGAEGRDAASSGEAQREALRELFESYARGDFSAGVELFDPEIRFSWDESPSVIEGRGLEELARRLREFLHTWEQLRVEAREIVSLAGDGALVVAHQFTIGRASGVRTESDMFIAMRFAGGRITAMHWSFDRAQALERAGLSE